jgi:hypothetical protein
MKCLKIIMVVVLGLIIFPINMMEEKLKPETNIVDMPIEHELIPQILSEEAPEETVVIDQYTNDSEPVAEVEETEVDREIASAEEADEETKEVETEIAEEVIEEKPVPVPTKRVKQITKADSRPAYTLAPTLFFSRLDAVDRTSGASAYLLSDMNFKLSGELLFPLTDSSSILTQASFAQIKLSEVLSDRTLTGNTLNLGQFSAGYAYQSGVILKALIGYEQRIHFTTNGTTIVLKPVPVPTLNLSLGYNFNLTSNLSIKLLGDYKYLFSASIPSLEVGAVQELLASIGPSLKLNEHNRIGVDFFYSKSQESSNLVKQEYQQVGGSVCFTSSF